jgi:hypothetical protein
MEGIGDAGHHQRERRRPALYFQFPVIDDKVPTAEDGPVESMHIPTKAKNEANAHTFLAYMETPAIGRRDERRRAVRKFDRARVLHVRPGDQVLPHRLFGRDRRGAVHDHDGVHSSITCASSSCRSN